MGKFRSYRNRPMHLGPYPLERLSRVDDCGDLSRLAPMQSLSFRRPDDPLSIVNAMQEYQAMLDATREGLVKRETAEIPADLQQRADHLKSFGYYCDASQVGICEIPQSAHLQSPIANPDVDRLAEKIRTMQPKSLAAGVDVIMAGLRESLKRPPQDCQHHTHALVFLYDMPRDPTANEPGSDWIKDAQTHRACLRAAETAVTLANYIRVLGFDARAYSAAASDVHLDQLGVAAGLNWIDGDRAINPFLGPRFGLAVITTTLAMAADRPLAPDQRPGFSWTSGMGSHAKNAINRDPFKKRPFRDGPHPFEKLKRVDNPITYIDKPNVARVPKRANMFARSLFGDLGKAAQEGAKNGNYVRKSASAFAFRPSLGAFILLQEGETRDVHPSTLDAAQNADNIKAALYFLGIDAVGLSACPDWTWYSHDAAGQPITPYHDQAISMIVD